jgi:uncharacterized membrane protein
MANTAKIANTTITVMVSKVNITHLLSSIFRICHLTPKQLKKPASTKDHPEAVRRTNIDIIIPIS